MVLTREVVAVKTLLTFFPLQLADPVNNNAIAFVRGKFVLATAEKARVAVFVVCAESCLVNVCDLVLNFTICVTESYGVAVITKTLIVLFTHSSREPFRRLLVGVSHASVELSVAELLGQRPFINWVSKHVVLRLFAVAVF